jgi:hypothetical protein
MDGEDGSRRATVLSRRSLLTRVGGGAAFLAGGTTGAGAQSAELTKRWQYAPGDVSNLAGHDGTYYLTAGETVQAVGATSGEVLWTADAGGAVPENAFALDATSETAVAVSESGTAVGVALNGDEQWRRSAGGDGIGVAVAGGTAYALAGSTVQAVDAASGEPVWSHGIPEAADGQAKGLALASTDSGVVPVYHTQNDLVGLDSSGAEQWRLELPVPAFSEDVFLFNSNNIVSQGQYVYYQSDTGPGDGDRHGMVDATTGTLVWERLDSYTNLGDLRGGPATFDGRVVNSGVEATVLSVPGGSTQWRTGITAYDSITGTSEALYVAGDASGTATVRSFGAGGTINWTLEFGEYDEYDSLYNEAYEFFNVPPAVTDGSVLFGATPGSGERALRCYELPESEWLAEPQRETPTTGNGDETARTEDGAASDSGDVGPPSEQEPSPGRQAERGFFTNGENAPLGALSGANLTLFSTAVTVLGIVITVYDLLRGGDN